jgi:geranylgeranyl diphosphate synthase, type II
MNALQRLADLIVTTSPECDYVDHAGQTSDASLSFETWKTTARIEIEAEIARYLDALPQHSPLALPLRHAMTGGKRFRALLARAACEALGGDTRRVLGAALALEMIQAQSLILDDLPCMDNADERRGHPSLHRLFGEPLALLAAATLLSDAYAALTRDGSDLLANKLECIAVACGSRGIAHGQATELCGKSEGPAKKTAPLLVAAAHLGAMAAGDADSFRAAALCAFAGEVGLAYQLRDDALDGERDQDLAARSAQRAIDRALIRLSQAGLDTPILRALAREAVQRER